jgi:hypothetical protein
LQCGVAALVVLASLPFVLRRDDSVPVRVVSAVGFVVVGTAAWAAGLFLANVNFLCRLF